MQYLRNLQQLEQLTLNDLYSAGIVSRLPLLPKLKTLVLQSLSSTSIEGVGCQTALERLELWNLDLVALSQAACLVHAPLHRSGS